MDDDDEWAKCAHEKRKSVKAPNDFECDACGLQYSSAPPTLTMFRETCLLCEDCGLFVHEKCKSKSLSPSSCLYAQTRIQERRSQELFFHSVLPDLKRQYQSLVVLTNALELEMKQLLVVLDESIFNREWALRTFATQFYSEVVPEKLEDSNFIPTLVATFGKSPMKFRLFFEKLLGNYAEQRGWIQAEWDKFEEEFLSKHDEEITLYELKEAQQETLLGDRDELFQEIHFPMKNVMNSPWRMRFSVQDVIVVAIGDFFLDHFHCNLHIVAGVKESTDSFVLVEVSGFDSELASVSASVHNFSLFGTNLPISSYSASSLSFSFDFSLKLRADFVPKKKKWIVNKEDTTVAMVNFKHQLHGASFPIPARVLDMVFHSVFVSQMKQAMLALLPNELGDYLVQLGKTAGSQACDVEFRVNVETKHSREFLHKPLSLLPETGGMDCAHLSQVCSALSPRQPKPEEWTFSKLLLLYHRFFRGNEKWTHMFRLYGFTQFPLLFEFLRLIDAKPCQVELECIQFKLFVGLRQAIKVSKEILLRVYSSNAPASSTSFDTRKFLPTTPEKEQRVTSTAYQTRAVVSELFTQAESFVQLVQSYAVRELLCNLQFSTGFDPKTDLLSLGPFRMMSNLVHKVETTSDWFLQPAMDYSALYPQDWVQTLSFCKETGAVQVALTREAPIPLELFVALRELDVRVCFDLEKPPANANTFMPQASSFVSMKLGFKSDPSIEAKGLVKPRVETTLERLSLSGAFSSLFRLLRDFRKSSHDEVDVFLNKMESHVMPGSKNTLQFAWDVNLQAFASEENEDLHVRVCLEKFYFKDDVELVTVLGGTNTAEQVSSPTRASSSSLQ